MKECAVRMIVVPLGFTRLLEKMHDLPILILFGAWGLEYYYFIASRHLGIFWICGFRDRRCYNILGLSIVGDSLLVVYTLRLCCWLLEIGGTSIVIFVSRHVDVVVVLS